MRNFESWETQDLETLFGLEQTWDNVLLDEWLAATTTFSPYEKEQIDWLKKRILVYVEFWNEDELKLQCISKMIDFAHYYENLSCNVFSQRTLSATINNIEIGGRVDFVLAKGRQKPTKPYFFIHEYKQETKRGSTDPKGQLLSEMLVAQAKNEGKMPVYGCYVLGRSWFFVILNGKEYAVSNAYNASDDDIYTVIAILRKVKEYIQNSLTG
jgi:hypothetical protein